MKRMKNSDSHYILYAKGWYVRTNVIDDLKKIHAHWTGYLDDIEDVYICDIFHRLLDMCYKHGMCTNEREFNRFVTNISPRECKYVGYNVEPADYKYEVAVIYACLSYLRFLQVRNRTDEEVITLDDPDATILPLNKDNK